MFKDPMKIQVQMCQWKEPYFVWVFTMQEIMLNNASKEG